MKEIDLGKMFKDIAISEKAKLPVNYHKVQSSTVDWVRFTTSSFHRTSSYNSYRFYKPISRMIW